jgi:hypothetical protein
VTPDGQARVVADNGIAVSPDHRRLVVAEMDGECLADYDIEPDGTLTFRRRLGRSKGPDGICLDADGAVWVASFNEDAFILIDRDCHERQRVPVPGRRAVACALGGPERAHSFASAPQPLPRRCGNANQPPISTRSKWRRPARVIPRPDSYCRQSVPLPSIWRTAARQSATPNSGEARWALARVA